MATDFKAENFIVKDLSAFDKRQKIVFNQVKNILTGLSVYQAEAVMFKLISEIKHNPTIEFAS